MIDIAVERTTVDDNLYSLSVQVDNTFVNIGIVSKDVLVDVLESVQQQCLVGLRLADGE